MKKALIWGVIVIVVAVGLFKLVEIVIQSQIPIHTMGHLSLSSYYVKVQQPKWNSVVASPLSISGEAVGGWYFEASFPIKLLDSNNQVIGQTIAQAQGDWMTTDFVPFTASLTFPTQPTGSQGKLVFEKDNPSGLPQNDDSYSRKVIF